ncbi:hypothetical protein [Scytonema sp. NUACC26]
MTIKNERLAALVPVVLVIHPVHKLLSIVIDISILTSIVSDRYAVYR